METVQSAREAVLKVSRRLPGEVVGLADGLGRTLDETVRADRDMPPFDKALVDGYAVRSSDLEVAGQVEFAVVDEIDAGRVPRGELGPGEAALVMTGAPLPLGADAVVMLEDAERTGNRVRLGGPVRPGLNRLERGVEYRAGAELMTAGTVLTPPRLGVLAAVGQVAVRVVQRPRVAVVTTGDELVGPDQVPGPGQIRDSNGVVLGSLVRQLGSELVAVERLPDQEDRLREGLGALLAGPRGETAHGGSEADVVLVSGGVSAGRRDLVPRVLEELGVQRIFHKVRVKPGKPLWFGVGSEREGRPPTLVFGLPGNPVSGIVSVLLFVAPALAVLAGRPGWRPRTELRILASPYRHRGPRITYHPARRLSEGLVEPLKWMGSADLRTVSEADGFVVFEAGDCDYAPGAEVLFVAWPSTWGAGEA
ncbi:MAG: molybdopterin molybdenumtransferase MoeA [Isosphaeraceae bacterium]|jgi:molybdopterin molybdotransferase|nr:MAG: molybdopterin molybdenumtransferase MoeA [Isosphaeraceae bacterium]